MTYLCLEHVSYKEQDHTGVDLVIDGPRPPTGHRLSNVAPDVKAGHEHKDEK